MSCPFNDYPGGPSYSESSNASWHSQHDMPYDYQTPYAIYSSGARVGESASTSEFPDSATFSPPYNYTDSPPEMLSFDEFDSPLSPSCSASSSSSSCSDAPVTPYYQSPDGKPLPNAGLLFTGLDAIASEQYCDNAPLAETYAYEGWEDTHEGWEDPDATQTYGIAAPQSSTHSSGLHTQYDHAAALRACDDAIAQLQSFDASPMSCAPSDPPNYASYASSGFPAVTSSAVSPPHAHEYPSDLYLSPSLLSCPPPLKLHQPQPRRSIPVVSLSALACDSSVPASSPALSPLDLQFPASENVVAYPACCSCPECTELCSIL